MAVLNGSAKGYQDTHLRRFANAFGTPNAGNSDYICHVPRMLSAELTLGFFPGNDLSYPPAAVVIWGTNKINSRYYAYKGWLKAAERGTRFAIVDPKRIDFSKKAEFVIQPRPGSDLALALAVINVVINDRLYDKEFVDNWTVGFDKLAEHVQQYSPEKVAELTWVSASDIRKLAHFYAENRPSCIAWGNGTDHNLNSFQTGRALSILIALTGDIGVPGGSTEGQESGFLRQAKASSPNGMLGYWSGELELRDRLSIEKWKARVGGDWGLVSDYRYVLPMAVTKAIEKGKPYPVRAAYIQATNPLSCWSNIKEAKRVLSQLEFLVVSDLWMTPTAALADIVLPSASYMEFDGIVMQPSSPVASIQRKVAQIGECRSDHETLNELAKRLGQEHFETADGFWDAILKPIGLTFAEFKSIGVVSASRLQWRAYQRRGFRTPSGKIELYSSHLAEEGLDPMPVYRELPESPAGNPELAKEYPLIFTNGKVGNYRDSSGRHLPMLRKAHPAPVIQTDLP